MHCDWTGDLSRGAVFVPCSHGQAAAPAAKQKTRDEGGEETEEVPVPLSGKEIKNPEFLVQG